MLSGLVFLGGWASFPKISALFGQVFSGDLNYLGRFSEEIWVMWASFSRRSGLSGQVFLGDLGYLGKFSYEIWATLEGPLA